MNQTRKPADGASSHASPPGINGFVKLPRALAEDPLWTQAPNAWLRVAIGIWLKANWKTGRWWDGRHRVDIAAGSFITSAATMCTFCRVTRQQYRDATAYLVAARFITSMRTKRYELISVLDPATSVGSRTDGNQAENQQRTKWEPSGNQVGTTIEERKKLRIEESSSTEASEKSTNPARATESQAPDDDEKPVGVTPSTPRAELNALIREATGAAPARADLTKLEALIESRQATVEQFLADIAPRLGRLSKRATIAFFFSQARKLNGIGEQPDPAPIAMSASQLEIAAARANGQVVRGKVVAIARCLRCHGLGQVAGAQCDCAHGAALARLEQQSRERRADLTTGATKEGAQDDAL